MIELTTQEKRVYLRLRALFMGQDICILLDGGEKPHIGALSIASHNGLDTYCLPKHKEDALTAQIAQLLQENFNVTVVCLCGIHIPSITIEEIATVQKLSLELAQQLILKIQFFIREKNTFHF